MTRLRSILSSVLAPALGLLLAMAGLTLTFSVVSCSDASDTNNDTPVTTPVTNTKPTPGFVGAKTCAECHQKEHDDWVGSHHEEAMKPATEATVLGDFNNATFEHFGVTSRFFKKDGKFFVNTDGPDGKNADFEIAYTFGIEPLQQYLIKFPGGKVQALTICWDSRPKEQGGQRWYHLYPDEAIPYDDALHWTGPNFTWNHMCAECHSTDLHKNYDAKTGTYNTTWSEINVSCEACHGPGKDHVEWANLYKLDKATKDGDMGLKVKLKDKTRLWVMNPETGIAQRQIPLKDDTLLNSCARCHSRRSQIADGPDAGVPFLENYHPSHLEENLYFADGQIQDEVYVWGSFTQSKMHMKGVTCMDCHDPHTARVPTNLNQLCSKCHMPAKFDTFEHHKHPLDSGGDQCVNCHMPHRTYMGVDDRRDHSFRIPRPDLSMKLGTPNACNQCHTEQSAQWAADAAAHWWGVNVERKTHFGEAFALARNNEPGADKALLEILRDDERPEIVRGTAAMLLARYPTRRAAEGVLEALAHKLPLVRLAAADALVSMPPAQKLRPALKLLDDPLRAIRIEAGNALSDIPAGQLQPAVRDKVKAGIEAYRKAQEVSADTAAANMNLGSLAYRMGDIDQAEQQYQRVLEIDPSFYPAYANLASIYSTRQEHDKALKLLDKALRRLKDQPDLLYARALVYVRQRDYAKAIANFGNAYAAAPQRGDLAYAYAVALYDTGNRPQAMKVLEAAIKATPNDTQILIALATYYRDARQFKQALTYAKRASKLMPDDQGLAQFVKQLEAATQ